MRTSKAQIPQFGGAGCGGATAGWWPGGGGGIATGGTYPASHAVPIENMFCDPCMPPVSLETIVFECKIIYEWALDRRSRLRELAKESLKQLSDALKNLLNAIHVLADLTGHFQYRLPEERSSSRRV